MKYLVASLIALLPALSSSAEDGYVEYRSSSAKHHNVSDISVVVEKDGNASLLINGCEMIYGKLESDAAGSKLLEKKDFNDVNYRVTIPAWDKAVNVLAGTKVTSLPVKATVANKKFITNKLKVPSEDIIVTLNKVAGGTNIDVKASGNWYHGKLKNNKFSVVDAVKEKVTTFSLEVTISEDQKTGNIEILGLAPRHLVRCFQ